jgi:hypothetical protein
MITPHDLGKIAEGVQKVKIDDLIKRAKREFKLKLIKSSWDLNGIEIRLTTSKTRFGGERIWFVCPQCQKRKGVIYLDSGLLGCRVCLNLTYRKQRYKGMIEANFCPTS